MFRNFNINFDGICIHAYTYNREIIEYSQFDESDCFFNHQFKKICHDLAQMRAEVGTLQITEAPFLNNGK